MLITLFTVPTVVTCRNVQGPLALKRLGFSMDLLSNVSTGKRYERGVSVGIGRLEDYD